MEGHCIMKTVWFYQKRLKKQAFVTFKLCFGKWSYVSWCALSVARNRLCPVSRFQLVQLRRTISVTRAGVRTVDLFFGRILKSMPLKSAGLPHARSNDALLAWASPQVTSLVQMIELGVMSKIWKKLWSIRVPQLTCILHLGVNFQEQVGWGARLAKKGK